MIPEKFYDQHHTISKSKMIDGKEYVAIDEVYRLMGEFKKLKTVENSNLETGNHILKKEIELDILHQMWANFVTVHAKLNFSENTFQEVQTKVSSRINQAERSIRDHQVNK